MTVMVVRSRTASRMVVLISDWIVLSSILATVSILALSVFWNVSTNSLVATASVVNVAVSLTFWDAPSSNLMRAEVGI